MTTTLAQICSRPLPSSYAPAPLVLTEDDRGVDKLDGQTPWPSYGSSVCSLHVLRRPPGQREIAGPERGSSGDARSAARTALTPVRTGVGFPAVDVVRPRREVQGLGLSACRAALPREGRDSRAPLVAATSTPTAQRRFPVWCCGAWFAGWVG